MGKSFNPSTPSTQSSSSSRYTNFKRNVSPHASLNDLLNASSNIQSSGLRNSLTESLEIGTRRRQGSRIAKPDPLKNKAQSTGELAGMAGRSKHINGYSTGSPRRNLSNNLKALPWAIVAEDEPLLHGNEIVFQDDNEKGFKINIPVRSGSSNARVGANDNIAFLKKGTDLIAAQSSSSSTLSSSDKFLPTNQELSMVVCSPLGDIYSNSNAVKAYRAKKLNSESLDDGKKLRVLFVNQTNETLVLCWVGFDHKLHHYYKLKPSSGTTIIGGLNGGSTLKTQLEGGIHSEHTFLGHSFLIGTCPEYEEDGTDVKDYYYDDNEDVKKSCWFSFGGGNVSSVDPETQLDKSKIRKIIAAYRPKRLSKSINLDEDMQDFCIHMVTITEELGLMSKSSSPEIIHHLSVNECKIDSTPLDTSNKVYEKIKMNDWDLYCEKGLFLARTNGSAKMTKKSKNVLENVNNTEYKGKNALVEKVRKRLELDLAAASKKLPPSICKRLKNTTPIWINQSQLYGPRAAPIKGKGMCFHPGEDWLERSGMSKKKCGGVELYEVEKYLDDCDLWYGTGGVLLHELSHAFHNKFIEDGYENKEIIDCYNAAMEEKLYDCVAVHSSKGGVDKQRAYACTDAMEYFAELSVAFLGGVGDDEDLEFNKWFPFNRKQIQEHDPRAYCMLKKFWEEENPSEN